MALLMLFPQRGRLERMLSFGLDIPLARIAGATNLSDAVFDLLKWVEARSKVQDLLTAAVQANPNNAMLKRFAGV